MRRNKLYTVNKWNRPAFMGDRTHQNIFDGYLDSRLTPQQMANLKAFNLSANMTPTLSSGAGLSSLGNVGGVASLSETDPTKFFGLGNDSSSTGGLFSKANLNGALSSVGTSLATAGAGLLGGMAGSAIAGGLSSKAGNMVGSIGSTVLGAAGTAIGGPIGGAIGSAVGNVLGGVTNTLFGSKLNEEKIAEIENTTENINNQSMQALGASSTDDLISLSNSMDYGKNFSSGDVGQDGLFASSAKDEYNRLLKERRKAKEIAGSRMAGAARSIDARRDLALLANVSAFGGNVDTNREKKDKMTNLFIDTPSTFFDFGGDLQTHGGDYPTGLTHISAGGSHEENPYDGVQMGVDQEGTPNLVEEGETVYDDYVFSNRILADEATKKLFRLPKKKDVTFADISKRLEKEIAERPNDPISEAGFKAQMQTLQDQQERQKQEMEAERAKEAFEALSPEEQVAVMQQAAQQEAMAQEAAMQEAAAQQQPTENPQELAMAEQAQQQAVEAAPQMAEGGHLFAKGSYLWDKFWSPVNEYSKKKGNNKNKYQIDKTYKGDIKELENSEAYKAFTDYILNNASDEERLKYFRWIDDNTGRERTYTNNKGELLEGWQDKYKAARNDGLYGIQHYTPEWQAAVEKAPIISPEARVFHALEDDEDYIQGELDPNVVGDEVRRSVLPNGDTVIYHARKATPDATISKEVDGEEDNSQKQTPKLRPEWMRYAGLFGPAVGLGMMAAGVGKPEYSELNAAVNNAGKAHLATYKPIGSYLTYRPMDIWFEQNRMDANARATDRAITNNAAPIGTKMAGLLASGYNNQIANGQLYRNALEYNDAKRERVAAFNRDTDKYNADAFTGTSRFNASALNEAEGRSLNARLHAASERLNRDAGWYNSIYGNVAGLFRGLSDLGRENAQWNTISRAAADTTNLGDSNTADIFLKKKKKSQGGKVRRKRGLTY